jgi:serine/threonine protein kinase
MELLLLHLIEIQAMKFCGDKYSLERQRKVNFGVSLEVRDEWLKELQGVIRLDCKNIVNYLSCERRSYNELILISEMMTRGSFSEYLAGLKQPRMNICQNWFKQILSGLSTLHNRRITHGRLSCEHIFINSNTGEVKIGDLSLVKLGEIIHNRLLPHRPIDDIHQFGLLTLEIAFFQFLPNLKLRSLINKYYDTMELNVKKISNLAQYIEDNTYRSLILHCITANNDTTANDILNHPFFSKTYAREETLKALRRKAHSSKLSGINLTSKSSCIDITVKIIAQDADVVIKFKYNTITDTPEGIEEEMRRVLGLSEVYIGIFKDRLKEESNP